MILAYTGRPGSGKTYRAVKSLLDLRPGPESPVHVIHNIRALKLPAREGLTVETVDSASSRLEGAEFLTLEGQAAICEAARPARVVLVLDEAQTYLSAANKGALAWLTQHRHLGQEVWLITQTLRNLHRSYSRLVELEYRGKKGSVFPLFLYSHFSGSERIAWSWVPEKRSVYKAYQSVAPGAEHTRGSRSLLLAGVGSVALVAVCYALWQWGPGAADRKVRALRGDPAAGLVGDQERKPGTVVHRTPVARGGVVVERSPPPDPVGDPLARWRWAGRWNGVDRIWDGIRFAAPSELVDGWRELYRGERELVGLGVAGLVKFVRGPTPDGAFWWWDDSE